MVLPRENQALHSSLSPSLLVSPIELPFPSFTGCVLFGLSSWRQPTLPGDHSLSACHYQLSNHFFSCSLTFFFHFAFMLLSASPPFQLGLLFHPNHLFSCQEERSLQRFKRREGGTPLGKFPGCPGHPHCSPGFTLNSQPRGPCRTREEQHQETKTNLGTVVQDIPPGAWRRPNSAD